MVNLSNVGQLIKSHPIATTATSSALGVGVATGVALRALSSSKKSSKRRRTSHKKRKTVRHHKRGRHKPRTAGKRRDTSKRRIRYTKKGQPYVIKNGRARFIKKSSAKSSYKRKGGRY